MSVFQVLILLWLVVNLFVLARSVSRIRNSHSFELARGWEFLGIFVWGDAPIVSAFWIVSTLVWLYLNNSFLVGLTISVFWMIRSLGETVYWLNEQFAVTHRNKPENLLGYSFFKSEAIYFVYQLWWQIVTVISILTSIYFATQLAYC